jgi:hypothetical protein
MKTRPFNLFSFAVIILCVIGMCASCAMTTSQQNATVLVAEKAVKRLDKNNKILPSELELIKLGVLAATSPKDRDTDARIKAASLAINAAVERGAIDQKTADDIDLLLALASLAF